MQRSMNTFSMNCTCGDPMSVEAGSREEAVTKLQDMMNAEAIAEHMAKRHPGSPIPTVSMVHGDIAKNLQPA